MSERTDFSTRRGVALAGAAGVLLLAGGVAVERWRSAPASATPATPGPVTVAPAPKPAPPWTHAQAADLLDAVKGAAAEGLRPADYRLDALAQAVDAGADGPALDRIAGPAALALARDYAAGRVRGRHRFNWYIERSGPSDAALAQGIESARADGRLAAWLRGLLPDSAAYRALRDALAATGDDQPERRDRIRANLERWRWLPRGAEPADLLYVNLPTYRLKVRHGGETVDSYAVVIGATDMPTPTLVSTVKQVVANPAWIVPASIVRKSHIRPSAKYQFTTGPDGQVRVRQKPGPGNALGQVKIEFPNKLAIYLHDTPSRGLFGASVRAFSHGCVRVQHVDRLATSLLDGDPRFAEALAGSATRWFPVKRNWGVEIVYLTMVPGADGTLTTLADPYRYDSALAAALDGKRVAVGVAPATPVPLAPKPRPAAEAPSPAPVAKPAPDTTPTPALNVEGPE